MKAYRAVHRDARNAEARQRRAVNPERTRALQKAYRTKRRDVLSARRREQYAANPEPRRAHARAYYAANPARGRAWYAANKNRVRARKLRRMYGLSPEALATMIDRQDGMCSICEKPFASGSVASVDHNHATGRVRGVLHDKCNRLLALANDTSFILENAVRYLERTA